MKYTLQVSGMTCSHCESAVRRALTERDGQARIDIDRPSGAVQIISTAADSSGFVAAIEEEGYKVDAIESEAS